MNSAIIIGAAVLVAVILLALLAYLLGFRVGGRRWRMRVEQLQAESIRTSRAMHDLTRQAFAAMAEHADRRQVGE